MLSEGEAHLKMYPNNFGIIWYIDMLLLHILSEYIPMGKNYNNVKYKLNFKLSIHIKIPL